MPTSKFVKFRGQDQEVEYNSDWENGQCWVEEWWFTDKTLSYDDITEAETEAIDAELLRHLVASWHDRGSD